MMQSAYSLCWHKGCMFKNIFEKKKEARKKSLDWPKGMKRLETCLRYSDFQVHLAGDRSAVVSSIC